MTAESELREAVARAERQVVSLRAAVAQPRRDAERRKHLRRTAMALTGIGLLGLGGSYALGCHLTNEERERSDRLVVESHTAEIALDRGATERCEASRATTRKQAAECNLEVTTLLPHARPRMSRGCLCEPADPLCECP